MQSDENTNTASGCQSILETRTHKVVLIFFPDCSVCMRVHVREGEWVVAGAGLPKHSTSNHAMKAHQRETQMYQALQTEAVNLFCSLSPHPVDVLHKKKKKKKAVVFHFHMKTPSFCHDQSMKPHVYSTYHGCVNCQYEHGRQVKSSAWQPGTQTSELTQCVGFSLCSHCSAYENTKLCHNDVLIDCLMR